jgi:adenosylcobyric acid synthase
MGGGLQVCGTGSDVGKSQVVVGLCRLLARRGVRVAPFKAQNMALNSYVTAEGGEIGRAQAAQAMAAGIEPEIAMNPILLKPTAERTSQVVVHGRPVATMSAAEYHEHKPDLLDAVLADLADLRRRFDVVLVEGAGSPAEINLLDHDIVNLRIAAEAGLAAVVVGDIDRGGVFAALYGTVALLPDELRACVQGFLINKFRGDPALLEPGLAMLEERTGIPTFGVIPMVDGLSLDAEDSLALDGRGHGPSGPAVADPLDVAVLRFPRISNFTDLDALALEPGVSVRFVAEAGALGDPDLVVLPGTKSTVDDLAWLRAGGFEAALASTGAGVVGICGGYQMLGVEIDDDVESGAGRVDGLGLLDVRTRFDADKVTRRRPEGYEIHHGRIEAGGRDEAWLQLDDGDEGAVSADGRVRGSVLHGLFEDDGFRATVLVEAAARRGKRFVPAGVSFVEAREAQFDRLADLLEAHVDLDRLLDLI